MVDREADPKATNVVRVRPGTDADVAVAVGLHVGQIEQGFLASLGPPFLGRLYRRVLRSPDSFLIVAEADGAVVGFVAGSVDVRALYRRFIRHDGVAAVAGAVGPLLHALPQAWETLRHGRGSPTGQPSAAGAELLAVAVDPGWEGRGVGRRLVDSFLGEVARRGAIWADVVVGADNARAVALYRAAGFDSVETFELHRGTRSVRMRWAPP